MRPIRSKVSLLLLHPSNKDCSDSLIDCDRRDRFRRRSYLVRLLRVISLFLYQSHSFRGHQAPHAPDVPRDRAEEAVGIDLLWFRKQKGIWL